MGSSQWQTVLRVLKLFESKFNWVFRVLSVEDLLLLVTECLKSAGVTSLIEDLERAVSFGGIVRFLYLDFWDFELGETMLYGVWLKFSVFCEECTDVFK